MKAAICSKYGPPEVLKIQEVAAPVPNEEEILVEVRTSTVAAADYRVRSFKVPMLMWLPARLMMGITKPKRQILGAEFAGVVTACGKRVSRFKPGDEVLGASLPKFGGYGEYLCVNENGPIVKKPSNISWLEAAAIPIGAKTALYYLDLAQVELGQKILIYGASGSVGVYAIQLAKLKGLEVTAVCSAKNFKMTHDLGADFAIDYTTKNWHEDLQSYDLFFQAVDKCSFSIAENTIKQGGTYINISKPIATLGMLVSKLKKKMKFIMAKDFPQSNKDLKYLVELVKSEKLNVVIDKVFPLDDIVEAHQYVDKGNKAGNVIVKTHNF
ncbi:NAD(P)-dependent alcohol dehydrogenase [Flagellimonas meridianipacifica]|uniref:NADPH:quinone reductase-like Zn-dependent oxidoreductase n=1 Tax=Flagellimonas meridianipacifica TaxID=1080225 RepID=A0A2T0MIG8_9FLAO|nr:NAD(P)-dependent alcohol dehydrogenase [Allomuricauda pacifica]PRX57382.1 NADPH:quinone reductase-like Zn-dependent oxidoreductase [Allomuricauda pacifica]